MPFWRTFPVDEEPVIELARWQVYEVPGAEKTDRDRHFSGSNVSGGEPGRASSKIVSFDRKSRTGVTRSGRKYKLVGKPAFNWDALHVWDQWLSINKIEQDDVVNVTEDYV